MKDKKTSQQQELGRERANYIAKLIAAYLNGTITIRGIADLEYWLNESDLNKELFRYFTDPSFLLHLRQQYWN